MCVAETQLEAAQMKAQVLFGSDQDGSGKSTSGGQHMLDGLRCHCVMVRGCTEERKVHFLPAMRSREIALEIYECREEERKASLV